LNAPTQWWLEGGGCLGNCNPPFYFLLFFSQKELFKCLPSKLSKVMGKKKRAIQNWSLKTKVLKANRKCVCPLFMQGWKEFHENQNLPGNLPISIAFGLVKR